MPIDKASSALGIVSPTELKFLANVFEATSRHEETPVERENRAFFIIHRYQSGIVDRDILVELVKMVFKCRPGPVERGTKKKAEPSQISVHAASSISRSWCSFLARRSGPSRLWPCSRSPVRQMAA